MGNSLMLINMWNYLQVKSKQNMLHILAKLFDPLYRNFRVILLVSCLLRFAVD